MATKILKLRTGEELLASVETTFSGETATAYTLKNPLMVIPVPSKDGQYHGENVIVPWMTYVKQPNGITISADAVLVVADPITELQNEYNKAFGSGLLVPSDTLIRPALKLV